MQKKKDYYAVLGVDKSASGEDIKRAFRKLAHKYHPDKGGDTEKFKEVNEAYSILSDEKKRKEYDTYGNVFSGAGPSGGGFESNFDFGDFANAGGTGFGFDIGDIFEDFFSGGGAGGRARRGSDISVDIQVPFADAVFGTERKILITKTRSCERCNGSGGEKGTALVSCNACGGSGKVHETKRSFLGSFTAVKTCGTCVGSGQVPKEKCEACKGAGVMKGNEEITINIPAGISDGEMIRMSGRGEAIHRGVPGDLYIKVHVPVHPVFKKEGKNLLMDLDVKLSDAILGAEYTTRTLDGEIKLTIPAGVSYGEVLRVRGRGVPVSGTSRGDLLARVIVKTPSKLSKHARELIEKLKDEGV